MNSDYILELQQHIPEAFSEDLDPSYRWGGYGPTVVTVELAEPDQEVEYLSPLDRPAIIPGLLDSEYQLPNGNPEVLQKINELGAEAITWYVSSHIDPDRWGEYMREDALETFARQAFRQVPGLSDADRLVLACQFVIDHEIFHYWIYVASAQIEIASTVPVYVPHLRAHVS